MKSKTVLNFFLKKRPSAFGVFLFGLAGLLAPANGGSFISYAGLSYGEWQMIKPLPSEDSSSNADLEAFSKFKAYRTISLGVQTARWHHLGLSLSLPYTHVEVMEAGQDSIRSRSGFKDLDVSLNYKWKEWTLRSGMSLPLGYDFSLSELWLGSGSPAIRSGLSFWKRGPAKLAFSAGTWYNWFAQNGRVGWGSWESGAAGSLSRRFGKQNFSLSLSFTQKSLSFLTRGTLIDGSFGEGIGDPFVSREVTLKFGTSRFISRTIEISGGVGSTVWRDHAVLGGSARFGLKYFPGKG